MTSRRSPLPTLVRSALSRVTFTRSTVRGLLLLLLVPLIAIPIGVTAQRHESEGSSAQSFTARNPRAISVTASMDKVNPVTNSVDLRLLVTMPPELSEAGNEWIPSKKVTLYTSAGTTEALTFEPGRRTTTKTLQFDIEQGIPSSYPFDEYDLPVYVEAEVDGKSVPVDLTVTQSDPLFTLSGAPLTDEGGAALGLHVVRAQGSSLMAVLMMAIMWALALSICAATFVLLKKKSGLVWPAMGWMAATLFALAAFRNTAPGAPAIGSLLDYAAFFWAEFLVAGCVTLVVVKGTIIELAARKETA